MAERMVFGQRILPVLGWGLAVALCAAAGATAAQPVGAEYQVVGVPVPLAEPAAAVAPLDSDRLPGAAAGRVDLAAEFVVASWQAGASRSYLAAPSGDAWASTRQFPGRPH